MSTITPDSSLPLRRKRTATERLTENGDPLIANKKARDAAKKVPQKQVSFSSQKISLVDQITNSLPQHPLLPSQLQRLQPPLLSEKRLLVLLKNQLRYVFSFLTSFKVC